MSISYNQQVPQDSPHSFVKLTPTGENPLDLYAIFSRSRYKRDFSSILRDRDQELLNKRAKVIYRDMAQAKKRASKHRVHLEVNKNMIRVKVESAIQGLSAGGGKRSSVAGFSNKSRKRMIDLMNCQRHGSPKVFVSLTYADEALFSVSESDTVKRVSTSSDWKNHIEILRKRFERAYPDVLALWRIELKKRKSGRFIGLIAPHFHLLIWNDDSGSHSKYDSLSLQGIDTTSYDDGLSSQTGETFTIQVGTWLKQNWYEIVDTGLTKHLAHGTHVSAIKSVRHAMFYVSKYVAKQEDDFDDDYEVGRRWGRIGQFDTSISVELSLGEKEYIQFRRLLRAWLKSKARDYAKRIAKISLGKGFSVYGIGDSQNIGDDDFDIDFIMSLVLHACELVSIPIG